MKKLSEEGFFSNLLDTVIYDELSIDLVCSQNVHAVDINQACFTY